MTKNRKLTILFGFCTLLFIVAVMSVNVGAKYVTTGGGSATAYAAKWGAKVEGKVIEENDKFKYYEITAKPKGAEVASRIAIGFKNVSGGETKDGLPENVTPVLKKVVKDEPQELEDVELELDKSSGLYKSKDIIEPVTPAETKIIYQLTFKGAPAAETEVQIIPQIEQAN